MVQRASGGNTLVEIAPKQMYIFEQLQKNKGTTSSALGKKLANQVINGDEEILLEAVKLVKYDLKNKKSKNIKTSVPSFQE